MVEGVLGWNRIRGQEPIARGANMTHKFLNCLSKRGYIMIRCFLQRSFIVLSIFTSFGGNNYFGCGDESCEKWLFIVVIHADKSRRWQDQPRPQGLFIFGKRDPGEEVIRYHHKQDHNLTVLSMRNCGLTLRAFFSWPTSAWRPKRRYLFLWYVEFSYWFSSSHSSFSYIISSEEHAS